MKSLDNVSQLKTRSGLVTAGSLVAKLLAIYGIDLDEEQTEFAAASANESEVAIATLPVQGTFSWFERSEVPV